MTWAGARVLAVVPARGGSKGIPRKNLRHVGGVSLVGRVGRVTGALPWIDAAVLSTDDEEIAAEGRAHGLDAPFLRPPELSGDAATAVDTWRHAWLAMEALHGTRFDVSILLEPTSPLRRPCDVERTVRTLVEGGHRAAATVSRAPAHFTPHKCLEVDAEGRIGFYLAEGARFALRQKIPPYYFRNGVCYAVRRETLVDDGHILEDDCAAVVIDRTLVNIDEEEEIAYAEFLLAREGV